MAVETISTLTYPSGTRVSIDTWVSTLTSTEQAEYAAAKTANDAFIASNGGVVSGTTITYAVQPARFNTVEWKAWFDRYKSETGVTVNFEIIDI